MIEVPITKGNTGTAALSELFLYLEPPVAVLVEALQDLDLLLHGTTEARTAHAAGSAGSAEAGGWSPGLTGSRGRSIGFLGPNAQCQ